MRFILLFLSTYFISTTVLGQKVDTINYQLDTSINQNKAYFQFWTGSNDSNYRQLIILRVIRSDTAVLYNDAIRDGLYAVEDVNGDGFADFSTFYHDYQQVYMFNKKRNCFDSVAAGWLPGEITTISKSKKLYYGFYDAMYGHDYPSSTLYTFKNTEVIFLYQMIFVTKEPFDDLSQLKKIKIYKVRKGKENLLINTINIKYPARFNLDRFQRNYYKKLMHLS